MHNISENILKNYMVRVTKKQKKNFRSYLCEELTNEGYEPEVLTQRFLCKNNNIVVGDVNKAKVVLTAHYDTPYTMFLPNFVTPKNIFIYILYCIALTVMMLLIIQCCTIAISFVLGLLQVPFLYRFFISTLSVFPILFLLFFVIPNKNNFNDNTSGVITLVETALNLPKELREEVCFVFVDNEEKMLLGSIAFRNKNKNILKDKLVVNFDCVSDGDDILLIYKNKVKKDKACFEALQESFVSSENKRVSIENASKVLYPSDQQSFSKSVGIAALKRNKIIGLYLGRIHTPFDTIFDEENIAFLKNSSIKLIQKLAIETNN